MQQMKPILQDKKASKLEAFRIYTSEMVQLVDYRWNQLCPDILLLYKRLVKLLCLEKIP
jgi:hypothetical protein